MVLRGDLVFLKLQTNHFIDKTDFALDADHVTMLQSGKLVTKMFQKIQELIDDKEALVFVLIDEVKSMHVFSQAFCIALNCTSSISNLTLFMLLWVIIFSKPALFSL